MNAEEVDLTWNEAHRALVPLMRVDNLTNARSIGREYAALGLILVASGWLLTAWTRGEVPNAAFVPLAMVGMVLVATMQHRLSGLAHEASHQTLFRNRLANELASDILLMFPILAMTQKYRAAHLGHHRFVNDPLKDPDLLRINHPQPHQFPITKGEFWGRYVFRALWPPEILRYLFGRARAANLGVEGAQLRAAYRSRVARTMRGAYWLAVLTTVHATGQWLAFFVFWVLPLLTAYPFLMQLREIAHHMNAPDDGDFTNSRIFRVHPILEAAIFPYGQSFHLTHHLFAMIPHHRMAEAHAILSRYRPYREQVVVCRGYFFRAWGTDGPSVLDVLSDRRLAPHTWRGPSRPAITSTIKATRSDGSGGVA